MYDCHKAQYVAVDDIEIHSKSFAEGLCYRSNCCWQSMWHESLSTASACELYGLPLAGSYFGVICAAEQAAVLEILQQSLTCHDYNSQSEYHGRLSAASACGFVSSPIGWLVFWCVLCEAEQALHPTLPGLSQLARTTSKSESHQQKDHVCLRTARWVQHRTRLADRFLLSPGNTARVNTATCRPARQKGASVPALTALPKTTARLARTARGDSC